MLTKKFFLYITTLIFATVFIYDLAVAQNDDETMVDTIDSSENLLDSNITYKKQFDSLSKDGDWITIKKSDLLKLLSEETGEDLWENYPYPSDIIYIWRPFCATTYWNPYYDGSWIFTNYGWMWNSYYSWGWGPYNYGRWFYSGYYGWVWLPGCRWASNWVTWRCHNNYIGWYPTCPVVRWTDYYHVRHSNTKFAFKPKNWVIVAKKNFTKKIDNTTLVSAGNNADILKNSTKVKTSVYVDAAMPKIKYTGPDVNDISKSTGEKVQVKNVNFTDTKSTKITDDKNIQVYKEGSSTKESSPVKSNSGKTNVKNPVKYSNPSDYKTTTTKRSENSDTKTSTKTNTKTEKRTNNSNNKNSTKHKKAVSSGNETEIENIDETPKENQTEKNAEENTGSTGEFNKTENENMKSEEKK